MPYLVSSALYLELASWVGELAGLAPLPARTCRACHAHDKTRRTVTDQSGIEQAESQARTRPFSMDGDRIRLRNGFPRRFPNGGSTRFSDAHGQRMADRPQTPKDVSTLGLKPQPEELL